MSVMSKGTVKNDASPLFHFLFSWSIVSLIFFLVLCESELMNLLSCPLNIPDSSVCSLDLRLSVTFFSSVSLFLCRQTNYAQKPWKTHWIQCGTKRWCITASLQQTWPPKRSGRHSALDFSPAVTPPPSLRAKIYYANDENPNLKPSSDLPTASLLPSGLFQVL